MDESCLTTSIPASRARDTANTDSKMELPIIETTLMGNDADLESSSSAPPRSDIALVSVDVEKVFESCIIFLAWPNPVPVPVPVPSRLD